MFSFLSSYNQARWKSKNLKAQAKMLRKNAEAITTRAEAQAASITHAAAQNQRLEAENLMKARSNQRATIGQVRATSSGNGFTSEGTGGQAEKNAREMLDAYIANRALSASIAMSNAWQNATDVKAQANVEALAKNLEADTYDMQAKNVRRAANFSLVSGILGAAYGAYQGYLTAGEYNDVLDASNRGLTNAFGNGEISWEQMQQGIQANNAASVNPWSYAALSSSQMGDMVYNTTASFSPYISAFSTEVNHRKNNYGGMLSVLKGNVPYKVPAAGTIFSQF